ncbi:MAG: sigma-70 family RNA polymerase sigma factor, partial [Longimicrobiales bacterium]|nr:sigma-70 family RNA polymerase sigma factor [Longimicrobiales bacterium]
MTDDPVGRAQQGDAAAFDALYEAHVDRVFGLCLRMTADERSAEELTQDVFVKAWRRIGTFRGESAFATWLYRVTVNTVLDHRKARNRRPAQLSAVPEAAYSVGTGEDPGARLRLERAIASLPERARMAIVLHGVEGYSYEEVAELMGVAL